MGKNQDPESGINIPDPQHWLKCIFQVEIQLLVTGKFDKDLDSHWLAPWFQFRISIEFKSWFWIRIEISVDPQHWLQPYIQHSQMELTLNQICVDHIFHTLFRMFI